MTYLWYNSFVSSQSDTKSHTMTQTLSRGFGFAAHKYQSGTFGCSVCHKNACASKCMCTHTNARTHSSILCRQIPETSNAVWLQSPGILSALLDELPCLCVKTSGNPYIRLLLSFFICPFVPLTTPTAGVLHEGSVIITEVPCSRLRYNSLKW